MLCSIYLKVLYTDLKVPTVRKETTKFSIKYRNKIKNIQKKLKPNYLKKSLENRKDSNQQIYS
jgi:hypothetical protein